VPPGCEYALRRRPQTRCGLDVAPARHDGSAAHLQHCVYALHSHPVDARSVTAVATHHPHHRASPSPRITTTTHTTPRRATQALEAAALESGLADLARQALSADPEAAAQLKRYEAAVVRLEKAKAAEKELEAIMKVRGGRGWCVCGRRWGCSRLQGLMAAHEPHLLCAPEPPPCTAGRDGGGGGAGRGSGRQRAPACRPAAGRGRGRRR
jgi:hypothetical protein